MFKRVLLVTLFLWLFSNTVEALNESINDPMQKESKMELTLEAFEQWWRQTSDLLPEEKMTQAYTYVKQFTPREQVLALDLLKEKIDASSDEYKRYFQNHPLLNWLNALFVLNPQQLPKDILAQARQQPVLAIEDCLAMPAEQQAHVIQLFTEAEQLIAEHKKHLASSSNAETKLGSEISHFLLIFHTRQNQLKQVF